MNIEFPVPGSFQATARDDGVEVWKLSVPVFFTEISTVKSPAILDCYLRSCTQTEDSHTFRLGQTDVRAYQGMNDSPLIESRPIVLKGQDGDRNPLTLEFRVAPPAESKIEDEVVDLDLVVRLTFGSMTSIDIVLLVAVERALGTLRIREWRRLSDPRPILSNLGLFALCIALVGVWNFGLNREIHGRPSFLDPSLVSLALGAGMAFFGLSLSRIQSWFTALANFSGLAKWPEIHLDTSAGRLFAEQWVSIPLVILVFVSSFFVLFNYPVALPPTSSSYEIVDAQGTVVEAPNVYLRHIVAGEFSIACAREDGGKKVLLGTLGPGWRTASLSPEQFSVSYPSYLARMGDTQSQNHLSTGSVTTLVSGLELLEFDLDREENVLVPFLCGGRPRSLLDLEIRWEAEDSTAIVVVPRPPLDSVTLKRKLYSFRIATLRNLDGPNDLWLQRDRLSADLVDELQTTKRWLEPDTVVDAIQHLVSDVEVRDRNGKVRIVNTEQALERSILAQGVLQFYSAKRRGRLEVSHVEAIAEVVTGRFRKIDWLNSDRRATRAIWEILLRVEDLTTGRESLLHGASIQIFGAANANAIAQYLASCVRLGVLEKEGGVQARVNFFVQSWDKLSQLDGVSGLQDLANYILRAERFPEDLHPEIVHQWILSLFIPRAAGR